jgi:ketosteroid isomerase-like protein
LSLKGAAMPLRPRLVVPLATLLAACATGRAAPGPDPAVMAAVAGQAEAQARAADLAFSAAAVAHDAEAFASFLAADAVFLNRGGVAAGVAAICNDWAPLLAPGGPTLRWASDTALAAASGDLVMTRGAFTLTPSGDGPPFTGRYVTVWRREADGKMRVVLDGPDRPLPPGSSGAERRALRRVLSADQRLGAVAGLLLDGAREAGAFLLVEARVGETWHVLVEVGAWRPDPS